ncbi:MAG: hypothetical protein ACR2JY_07490 [Chloroflexota bacterium]
MYAGPLAGTLLRGENAETLLTPAFFAFLPGLAAKALLDKLRVIFKALF